MTSARTGMFSSATAAEDILALAESAAFH